MFWLAWYFGLSGVAVSGTEISLSECIFGETGLIMIYGSTLGTGGLNFFEAKALLAKQLVQLGL